jgi:acetylornithine aminotransferase
MTLGKALGGGVPVGSMFAIPRLAEFLKPGTHGCTLGGNPICANVAAAVMTTLEKENLPARANKLGERALAAICGMENYNKIKDIRGRGLMLGLEMNVPDGSALVGKAIERGLIINVTQKNVIRLAPALTIEEGLMMKGLEMLDEALGAM